LSVVAISVMFVSVIVEDPPAVAPPRLRPDLGRLGDLLDRLSSVLDEVVAFDPTVLSDEALEYALQREVEQSRRMPAVRNALVAEATYRVLPQVRQHATMGTYLRELVRCSAGEGNAWARQAEQLQPRPAISGGDPLPPVLPATAAAVTEGAVSGRQVAMIIDTMRKMPAAVTAADRLEWEALLARQARTLDPDNLDLACKHVLAVVDPDGSLGSRDEERARKRDFTVGRQGRDGMHPVRGRLDPETAAIARAALDPLAAPQPTPPGSGGEPAVADTRTAGQRYHDALGELCRRALTHGDLPVRHGHHATMLVTIRLEDLEARTGLASTATGGLVSVRDLLRTAADTAIIPIVLASDGVVLHYGEEQRLATPEQRRALIVTDIGCTWPGCSIPGTWCQAAHGEPFRTSRQTTLDDLALLCGYHHRYADTHNWTIQRIRGRVWLTPPRWIDADQTPRTNEYFRPLRT